MKKPRVNDFDPNAVPALGSSLEQMPAITPSHGGGGTAVALLRQSETPRGETDMLPEQSTNSRPGVRAYGRTVQRRTITRYAFEFYQDQIETLRRVALEDKFNGEKGSMSEMVREAVDLYIAKRVKTDE